MYQTSDMSFEADWSVEDQLGLDKLADSPINTAGEEWDLHRTGSTCKYEVFDVPGAPWRCLWVETTFTDSLQF